MDRRRPRFDGFERRNPDLRRTGRGLAFWCGGGVVADSRPTAEWQETELKAARFLDAARSARIYGTGRYIS
ncbi:MAG: chorismate-binding protein [Acidimicrobiia bacterium]|nr:chorismate-binding protein [Acidimicrobiia bacterium]